MKKGVKAVSALMISTVCLLGACSNQTSGEKEKSEAAFNKTGLPIVEEKVTLNFVSPKAPLAPNYGEMDIVKSLEKSTGVHIKWNNIPSEGYQEKKNLMLSSGDLPDAFYDAQFSDTDIITAGANGSIVPLEDLIEKYAPNIQKVFEKRPELKQMVTAPDGHIYSLPRAEEMGLGAVPNFHSINKAWLDKLGLKMPETLDEYYKVLKAFKEKDPNGNGKQDEIPLSFMYNFWTGNNGDLFAPFGMADNTEHRIVRDGKVIYTAVQPEYKEAIKYYHEWVKEGLIDPESFTQEAPQYLAKGKTEDPSLGSYIWWETEEVVGPERKGDYVLLPPLKGPDGTQLIGRSNNSDYGRAAFVITSANKNPEITMRWADQLYEPKMSAQISWGPIGTIFEEDENGMLVNKEIPKDVAMGELRQKVAPNGPVVILKEHFGTVVDMEPRAKERLKDLKAIYEPYLEKENYPQVLFSEQDLQTKEQIEAEIKEVVNQKQAQWLLEGGIEEEWDDYVQQLEDMGLSEMMQIYQKGLDDFNKK
ncbi:extracellular solute-binding protein [Bacillus mangrovi]|uniref:Extracellular solute-binding protein n=1 Tax=Metabacillus mangrovi TaxID=1491830 RepID=A0A7X2V681_9BACI|nr:ABC transporter substrate-binding protein [Metabacillus mangrovi]MTH54944.1 extracellular solute-binding protein [Metabacillus mangrovi]